MAEKHSSAESFIGSILKYSIATWLGFLISGLALIVAGILGPEKTADPLTFMSATATLMNIGILGRTRVCCAFTPTLPPAAPATSCSPCVCASVWASCWYWGSSSAWYAPNGSPRP